MPKINFAKAGIALVDEGTYDVVFKDLTYKKTSTKKDMWTIIAIIREDGSPMDGKQLRRNYVFDPSPDADNGGTTFYMQQDLIAFGADEDDVTSDEDMDPVVIGTDLKGNTAKATVAHSPDRNDPKVTRAEVRFHPEDFA